jgi:putative ABC transport system permease protein
MNLWESTRTAAAALHANRLRSLLTMLGIIIGVGAVITMVAIGEGSRQRIAERMSRLGTNLLFVRPGAQSQGRTSLGSGTSVTLTAEDALSIKKHSPLIVDVSPEVSRNAQVKFANRNVNTSVVGATLSYPSVRNFRVVDGRFFNEQEFQARSKVAIIGNTVLTELFEDDRPVGKTIKISNQNFQVIGVLERKGSTGMQDQDDQIIVPLQTAQMRLFGIDHVTGIAVQIADGQAMDDAMFDMERTLRRLHRLRSDQENDFNLRSMADVIATAQEASQTMSLLLASIAAISLVVGGIGIMNIMVVSVTERTKEIGIRKAIGAKRRDILLQFLIEALMICLFGGLLGVAAGTGAALFMKNSGWAAVITPDSIVLSFGLSACVGIFFGFYPAWKAARANVIDSLRYE